MAAHTQAQNLTRKKICQTLLTFDKSCDIIIMGENLTVARAETLTDSMPTYELNRVLENTCHQDCHMQLRTLRQVPRFLDLLY